MFTTAIKFHKFLKTVSYIVGVAGGVSLLVSFMVDSIEGGWKAWLGWIIWILVSLAVILVSAYLYDRSCRAVKIFERRERKRQIEEAQRQRNYYKGHQFKVLDASQFGNT